MDVQFIPTRVDVWANLAATVSNGVHSVRLLAYAEDEWWSSRPFEYDASG